MSDPKEKFPQPHIQTFDDPNNITVSELVPGVLNPIGPVHGHNNIARWDSNDIITSSINVVRGMIDDSQRITTTKFTGVVASNPTPANEHDDLPDELREISKDIEYKLGHARSYCYIYIPEIHMYNRTPDTFDPSQLDDMDMASIRLLPKIWGPRDFVKELTPGSFLEVEFTNPKDFTYGKFTTINKSVLPRKKTFDFKRNKARDVKKAAKNPNAKKASAPATVRNAPDLKPNEEKLLSLPPPKDRPSPKSRNLYHSSVNKALLIGPSPRGHIDWTGCGGRGTLSMSGGKPKSGPKKYYLKGDESDASGNLIITLPSEVCYGRILKGHRAVVEPLKAMLAQARADGLPDPLFKVYSCWRDVKQQHEGFKYWFYSKYGGKKEFPIYSRQNAAAYRKCRKYNGDPFDPRHGGKIGGDHMAGRGVDLFLGTSQSSWCARYQKNNPGTPRGKSIEMFKTFMESKASYQWLKINAEFFGFYNYPAEPWHWCYNPDDRPERSDVPLEVIP